MRSLLARFWAAPVLGAMVIAAALLLLLPKERQGIGLREELAELDGSQVALVTEKGVWGHIGDEILYTVKIVYSSDVEIEKEGLMEGINFAPFEVRGVATRMSEEGNGLNVYTMEYHLQLLEGERDARYDFPPFEIVYRNSNTGSEDEFIANLDPIFIGSRMPSGNLDSSILRPAKGPLAIERPSGAHFFGSIALGVVSVGIGIVLIGMRLLGLRRRRKPVYPDWYLKMSELAQRLEADLAGNGDARQIVQVLSHAVWTLRDMAEVFLSAEARGRVEALLKACDLAYAPEPVSTQIAKNILQEFTALLAVLSVCINKGKGEV